MKLSLIIILGVFLFFLGFQIYSFWREGREAGLTYKDIQAQLVKVRKDQEALQSDYQYYLNPANLEKELRARFNYRQSDEKLIIIVPSKPTPPTTSSTE